MTTPHPAQPTTAPLASEQVQPVRIALIGTGNCATALVAGLLAAHQWRDGDQPLNPMHEALGGLHAHHVHVVAAIDVDERKVGHSLHAALLAEPNCTPLPDPSASDWQQVVPRPVYVACGVALDGVAPHMDATAGQPADPVRHFRPSPLSRETRPEMLDMAEATLARHLRDSGAEVALLYLPVGSEQAARFYARVCLRAGVSLVNCIPVFLSKDAELMQQFRDAGLAVVGDDIKSQVGATIVHRALRSLFERRGVLLESTYQLNVGGNTDFANMLDRARLDSKKVSKTQSVQTAGRQVVQARQIHVGPSDFVPSLGDTKIAFIRLEGALFGGVGRVTADVRLEVTDSPNSAGTALDALRLCALYHRAHHGGPLASASAWTMKSPATPCTDDLHALDALERDAHAVRGWAYRQRQV